MKELTFNGLALSESDYDSDKFIDTSGIIAYPNNILNYVHTRPSLIPGIKYPITEKEERLLDLAWNHAIKRMQCYLSHNHLLEYMRDEVERIRFEELGL